MSDGKWGNIPTSKILKVNIASVDMPRLLAFTQDHLPELSGEYICAANAHTTVMAYEDPDYLAVQNGAALTIPDGGPLVSVARLRGVKGIGRTSGPSYMEEIFRLSAQNGWRHYFYGATEQTLEKIRSELTRRYPQLQIAGMYSPPFRSLSPEEDQAVTERINEARADFVWVGLGAPKQEKWMAAHRGRIRGLMVGVGAGFDYFAGNIRRAPAWMQKCSLEWLCRLAQEPKRLFKRYLVTNTKFIWHAVIRGK